MNHSEAGKGDSQRPTDTQKYAANYTAIFGTKTRSLPLDTTSVDGEQKPQDLGENK